MKKCNKIINEINGISNLCFKNIMEKKDAMIARGATPNEAMTSVIINELASLQAMFLIKDDIDSGNCDHACEVEGCRAKR